MATSQRLPHARSRPSIARAAARRIPLPHAYSDSGFPSRCPERSSSRGFNDEVQSQRPSGHLPGAGPTQRGWRRRHVRRRARPYARRQGRLGHRRWRSRSADRRRPVSVQCLQRQRFDQQQHGRLARGHYRQRHGGQRSVGGPVPDRRRRQQQRGLRRCRRHQLRAGILDGRLRRLRDHLPGGRHGVLQRVHPHRLRHRFGRNGTVLLSARPDGLHRPLVLERSENQIRRQRRTLHPGLRAGPRIRPPCAEPAGHQRPGGHRDRRHIGFRASGTAG